MSSSANPNFAQIIPRRDRPFNLAYYKYTGEESDGTNGYTQILITRVKHETKRVSLRDTTGFKSGDVNLISIELRDSNLTNLDTSSFEKDFCILYTTVVPDIDLNTESATAAGHKAWVINGIKPIYNPAGKIIQLIIEAN